MLANKNHPEGWEELIPIPIEDWRAIDALDGGLAVWDLLITGAVVLVDGVPYRVPSRELNE